MKVLELFAGTRSISKAFEEKGHECFTIEFDTQHDNISWYEDVMKITAQDILEKFGRPDVIWASPPCFTGETLVLTDDGFKKIEELELGDMVITHKNRYRKVIDIGRKKVDNVRIIKTTASNIIETTDEHPFYARKNYRKWNNTKRGYDRVIEDVEWINAADLEKNWYVGYAINQKSEIPNWEGIHNECRNQFGLHTVKQVNNLLKYMDNNDFWWLIGRYMGDGYCHKLIKENGKDKYSFIITCDKKEVNEISDVLDRMGDFFKYSVIEEKTACKFFIYKKELVEFVEQFGKYAYGKKLNGTILNLPKHLLKSFLDGYFSADGHTIKHKNSKVIQSANSVSKELLYGIGQCVVKVYNKPFSLYNYDRPKTAAIEGRTVNQRPIWRIDFELQGDNSLSFIEDGILWTQVRENKVIDKDAYVYNITVEEDNTYTANGIIVHNCEKFSVAAIGKHWIKGTNLPKTEETKQALKLLEHTVNLVKELNPKLFFFENPRGKMRKMDCMQEFTRHTVTYCLRGDTRIITKEGTFEIKDLVDKEIELLTVGGKWVKAPINNYGKQKLMKLTVSRAGKQKEIYATPDHKWFVNGKIIETDELNKGQRLDYVKTNHVDVEINNEWVARGFVYGDGWAIDSKPKGFVQFCNEKHEVLPYFDGVGGKRWNDDKDGIKITKLYGFPREWKTKMPSVNESPSNIFSWLAGYIAADGSVHKNNAQVTLSSSKKEDLEHVRDLCRVIGIDTYSIVEYWRKGYGKKETPLYQVTLMRSDVTEELFIREKHLKSFKNSDKPKRQPRKWSVVSVEETNLVEDVYCAEVPETHAFALEDGILTHNCQYGDFRMKPTDIWHNHPNPEFKPTCKNGDPCHVAAPRGSSTGTQGMSSYKEKSRIPKKLCEHIVNISEEYINEM